MTGSPRRAAGHRPAPAHAGQVTGAHHWHVNEGGRA